MKGIEMIIDPNDHEFYFDIEGFKNAGYAPFKHDYKPVHGPINVPLAQDMPKQMRALGHAAMKGTYDPYLAIAKLRRQFQGHGRKLAGFLIFADGVRGKLSDKMPYTVKNHPEHRTLWVATNPYGSHWKELRKFDVAHCVTMHLHWYMAFMERRLNYYQTCADLKAKIDDNRDPDGSAWKSLKSFKGCDGMSDAQWLPIVGKRFEKMYPSPALRRELMMPDGLVDFGEIDLGWDQVEACLKHTLEKGVRECGYIGYGDLTIVACDSRGAITVGGSGNGLNPLNFAHWGNQSYHVFLQDSIEAVAYKDFAHISDDPMDCLQHVAEMLLNIYDFSLERYLGRKRCTTSWMADAFSSEIEGSKSISRNQWMKNWREHVRGELAKTGQLDMFDDISGFEKPFLWAGGSAND